jgi:hypothetical protein
VDVIRQYIVPVHSRLASRVLPRHSCDAYSPDMHVGLHTAREGVGLGLVPGVLFVGRGPGMLGL